ncbi:MAG: hypothetical protein AB7Q00_08270 [Phycisphaerales bacterium]
MRTTKAHRTILPASAWCVWGVVGMAAGVAGPAFAQSSSWQYIPPLTGETYFFPTDISHSGIVIGGSGSIGNLPSLVRSIERFDPSSGATQTTILGISGSDRGHISGDGLVVGGYWPGDGSPGSAGPSLLYPDGTRRLLPSPMIQGELKMGSVQRLSYDGSSAALRYNPLPNGSTAEANSVYRWSLQDNIAQLPPSPLLGTTYSFVNGMSDDGRYIVGRMAPNTNFPDAPFAWDTQQNTLVPLLDENGQVMTTGVATTISGDGHTIFANARIIVDGVSTFWTDGQPFTGVFPSDASYDASVLVGLLGTPDGLGAWVWTESTGAVRANDYFRSFGLNFPATARIRDLMVSGDGRHFAGWMESGSAGFVVTIPAPGVSVSFILAGTLASTRRRRRPDALRA